MKEDNNFSRRIKEIISSHGITDWRMHNITVLDGVFHLGIQTSHFHGCVSIIEAPLENKLGISYCTTEEAHKVDKFEFTAMLDKRFQIIESEALVRHLTRIVTMSIVKAAPQGAPMPQAV